MVLLMTTTSKTGAYRVQESESNRRAHGFKRETNQEANQYQNKPTSELQRIPTAAKIILR